MTQYPYPAAEGARSIVVDILLTLVTCGIYGIYWQFKQMEILNAWLGREDFSFGLWLILTIVTCGIFAIYYEYKMAHAIIEIQQANGLPVKSDLPLICVVLSLFATFIPSLAIQQSEINALYNITDDHF